MTMTKDQAAEVERLESEARAKAAKHVANMLARPDQLEKVHQLTWRVSRWVPHMLGKNIFVKLRQGSGKDGQGMALKAKGLKA